MNDANNNKLAYLSVFDWKDKFLLTRAVLEKLNDPFPHILRKLNCI